MTHLNINNPLLLPYLSHTLSLYLSHSFSFTHRYRSTHSTSPFLSHTLSLSLSFSFRFTPRFQSSHSTSLFLSHTLYISLSLIIISLIASHSTYPYHTLTLTLLHNSTCLQFNPTVPILSTYTLIQIDLLNHTNIHRHTKHKNTHCYNLYLSSIICIICRVRVTMVNTIYTILHNIHSKLCIVSTPQVYR